MPEAVTSADYPAPDPSLANAMQPANQPNPTPPAPGSPEHQSLFNGWLDFLTHPEVSTALLQFGASMLQPAGWGQTPLGQMGQAVGEAGQAVSRYREGESAAEKQAADIAAQKATAANEAKRTDIAAGQAAEDVRYHSMALTQQEKELVETTRHQKAAEGLQGQQIASSAGSSAASTAVSQGQLALAQQIHADAQAAAAAAQPGTEAKNKADIAEAQARAELLKAQAAAATNVSKMNTQQIILRDQMQRELGSDFLNFKIAHPDATEDDYRNLQIDWANRIAAAGSATTTAPAGGGGGTTTTTAPAATVAPTVTPTTPTPASGGPQPQEPKKKIIPLSQVDPALFAAGKLAGTISAADENAFITAHTTSGESQEDLAKFMDAVSKELAKQQQKQK